MPFTVRVEDGRETAHYTTSAAQAAVDAEHRCSSPAVLVIRADEPFQRRRPALWRRLWEAL